MRSEVFQYLNAYSFWKTAALLLKGMGKSFCRITELKELTLGFEESQIRQRSHAQKVLLRKGKGEYGCLTLQFNRKGGRDGEGEERNENETLKPRILRR